MTLVPSEIDKAYARGRADRQAAIDARDEHIDSLRARVAELEADNNRLVGEVDRRNAQQDMLMDRARALEVGHDRYETLRRLNPRAFKELYDLNLRSGEPFDQIVDELKPFVRPTSSGEEE